ncbi:MAG: tetratricopeptide repeat protein [Lachnospiraceae bacterium]|nr:tetratricopeptide repeat protein [Lachnospiraceae bacterium]
MIKKRFVCLLTTGIIAMALTGCNDGDEKYDKGVKAFEAQNYESAVIYFSEAIEENPEVADYYIYHGMALIKTGNMEEAVLEFDKAILDTDNQIVRRNNKKAYRGKGIAYFEMADYEESVECFNKALEINELNDINKDINYYKSNAQEALKDYEGAVETCDKLLENDKSDASVFFRRAKCLAGLGKFDEAVKDYDKAIELDNTNYDYYFGKYDSLIEDGKEEEANEVIKKALTIKGSKKDNAFSLAKLYYLTGDFESAKPLFETAYEDDNMQAAYYLGVMYRKDKKNKEAAKYLKEYIDSETVLRSALPYSELILCDIYLKNFDEAKEMIEKAYKLKDADNMQVIEYNEVVLYEKMLDFDTAYEKCKTYMEKYPDDKAMAKELKFLATRISEK